MDFQKGDKYVALSELSFYYTRKNIKKLFKNNKFKISQITSDGELEIPNGSYPVSDIQGYLEYIIRKHQILIDAPTFQIYVNRIRDRLIFLE